MAHGAIDGLLNDWADANRLQVSTDYRDEEVRSLDLVSRKGKRYQIWLDAPRNGRVGVHVWNYKERRVDLDIAQTELIAALDTVLSAAHQWMRDEK